MMHAYNSIYLSKAAKVLGNMLHMAVLEQGFDGNEYLKLFIQSGIASEIESGNPVFIAGKSGCETFYDVISKTTDFKIGDFVFETFERSDVYWVGYVLAHYQWYSSRSFKEILEVVSYDDFMCLYKTMHEVDMQKVYEVLDEHFENRINKLKEQRKKRGLTQEELSALSGVSMNTIRAYEQNAKDIKKGQLDIVMRLARALECEIGEIV